MGRSTGLLAITLALAALPAGQLLAQGSSNQGRDDLGAEVQALLNVDLKLGPFYLQPEIGLQGGWESNPNRRSKDGSVRVEGVVRPSAALRIALPFAGRHEISARGRANYAWYSKSEDLRRFNTTAGVEYRFESERLRTTISDSFFRGQRGAFTPALEGTEGLPAQLDIDEITGYKTNQLNGNVEWDVRGHSGIRLRGGTSRTRYDASATSGGALLAPRLDRDSSFIGGSLVYARGDRTEIGLEYDYRKSDFTDPENVRNGWDDRSGMRIVLRPNPRFELDVFGGVRRYRPLREEDRFTGPTATTSLRVTPGGWVELTLQGERDVRLAAFENNSHYINEGGALSLLFAIKRRIRIGADGSYYRQSYPEPSPLVSDDGSVSLEERRDDRYRYALRFEWGFDRAGRIVTRLGRMERQSNFPDFAIHGWIAQIGYAFTY